MALYAVEVKDLMTREYWDVVDAVSEEDARAQTNRTWSRFGGKAGRVRKPTFREVEEYNDIVDIGKE